MLLRASGNYLLPLVEHLSKPTAHKSYKCSVLERSFSLLYLIFFSFRTLRLYELLSIRWQTVCAAFGSSPSCAYNAWQVNFPGVAVVRRAIPSVLVTKCPECLCLFLSPSGHPFLKP
uniref:Orf33 n=1 Tax=Daucus carota subsp. sativus TaxID=79200 RepID=I1TIE1_DAUCS|nr:orf33 [Daucus carota subsp. sativus]AEY81171.1 orf33 [Daucus carota subsp. sativus]